MIAVVLVVALAGIAATWVLAPALRRAPDRPRPEGQGEEDIRRNELEDAKRVALVAIVDLEQELDSGKLNKADFATLRARYEADAVAALRELDSLRDSTTDDDQLEAEIAAIKERMTCPHCGAARRPGRPCERCGA